MAEYRYIALDWSDFNESLNMETNIELGGVLTKERMQHHEEGLVYANMPMDIFIMPGNDDITTVTEKDGRKRVEVYSSEVEPKHAPLYIIIDPTNENTTTVNNTDKARNILVKTNSVEPRWPENLEIQLIPGEKDAVLVTDVKETNTRKIQITSSFLNTCAIKPQEREVVLEYNDWMGNSAPFTQDIYIEAEVFPNSFVRFTKGLEITQEQIREMNECGVTVRENLDGTFTAIAGNKIPDIDIPLHVSIL